MLHSLNQLIKLLVVAAKALHLTATNLPIIQLAIDLQNSWIWKFSIQNFIVFEKLHFESWQTYFECIEWSKNKVSEMRIIIKIEYYECITIFGTFVRWSFQFLTVRELNPSSTIGSHYHHHATLELLFYIFRHFYKR